MGQAAIQELRMKHRMTKMADYMVSVSGTGKFRGECHA